LSQFILAKTSDSKTLPISMKTRLLSATRLSFPLATAIAALLGGQSAQAQTTRYWDQNGATSGFGSATGTWTDPTVSRWSNGTGANAGTATPGVSITTLINDPLHFGTDTVALGTGTITVSGTVNAASLRFGSATTGNVILSGGNINLAAATSIHVGAGGTTVHTISSNITGAGTSLTKTGNSLILSGANSYAGSTIISSGTLTLGSTGALGSNPGVNGTSGVTIGGTSAAILASSLDGITIAAPITTANTGINSTISFSRGTAAVGSITLNGAISGNGNMIFTTPNVNSGGNVQTIHLGSTSNNYAGNTTFNTGNGGNSLTIRNSSGAVNALPTTTALTFGTGAGSGSGRTTIFDLNGQNQTLVGLSNAGLVPDDRNQRVTSANAATLTINNTTSYTFGGATKDSAIGTGQDGTVTSAQITGAISLVKDGAGTFTLGGTLTNSATAQGNAFTGSTKILGGVLVLGQSNSIQNSAFDTDGSILGDGANGLSSSVTFLRIGGLTGGNNFATRFTTAGGYSALTGLVLNPGTGVTNSYSGDIGDGAGAMNLTKSGAGTQILTGTNTNSGTTTCSAGVLFATQAAALPGYIVPGKVIFSGGTIAVQVGGGGWTALEVEALVTNATKTSGSLGIDTTSGSLVQSTSFTANTFGSTLGLNKLGSNDLTLDQPNTFTGPTTVTAGTLTLTNADALQNSALVTTGAGTVSLGSGTILKLGGLSGATGNLATVISNYSSVTHLNLNAPAGALLSYGGIIADGVPGMTVTKTGAGTQALTGANIYTGATQINGGILTFGNIASKTAATATAAATGSIGLGVKAADATYYSATDVDALFNNSLTGFSLDSASGVAIDTTNAGGSFDQTVALTAARSLSKTGSGILVLSQVNSHAGSTSVLQGTLSLTGSLTGGGAISTSGSSVFSQTSTGVISGASTFTQGSSGTSTLAGTNTYTGVTNVNLGQLTISNTAALGTTDGNTIVASGGRLALSTANLSVAEPLNITGTGTTATNGAISFGGAVTGMALTGPITLGGAALIQADGNTGSTLSGGISLGANVLTINADGGATQTINTVAITGTGGSLVKSGSGTLVLGGANSYTGATTVNLGTLSIADNDALGTTAGATTVNGGNGTNAVILDLSTATSDLAVAEPINLIGNTAGRSQLSNASAQNHTLSGPINVSGDTNVAQITSNNTGSITVSGDISGTFTNGATFFVRGTSTSATNRLAGSIDLTGSHFGKTDAGTWTVGSPGKTYSWTNTQLAVGTLVMGVANVLPSATILTMGNSTGATTPTLDLNGFNQSVSGITYSGQGTATGTKTITSATPAVLTVNNATDFITTGTNVSTNNIVLTGALELIKQGAGRLALNGVNTNSGNTTVNDGILSLTNADSALDANTGNDLSTVTIAATAGAILDLAYTGTDEVNALFIGGVQKAAGIWGSTTSGAPNTDAKITGTGTLTVATGASSNNYASWASDPTKGNIPGEPGSGDFDNDGITNIVEYALGQNPRVSTQPAGVLVGNTITYTKGADAIANGDVSWVIETSQTLGGGSWTPVITQSPADPALTIAYTFTPGTPVNNFARLKVTQAP
jgi:fibronectin-binding autotransporter adhesin